MTWTTPNNVSTGDASASQFNTETVANLQHLYDLLHTSTSYTPSLTNWTVGNGSISGSYRTLASDLILVRGIFTLGSTSGTSGNPQFSLPSGFTSISSQRQQINMEYRDASTGAIYQGHGYIAPSASAFWAKTANASGSTLVASGVPFTWTTSDTVEFNGLVEVQ